MSTLRKVMPGDTLDVSAETHNAFVEAAIDFQQRQRNLAGAPGRTGAQIGDVLVQNDTGAAIDRFTVLGLGDPIVLPTDNEDEFTRRVCFIGATPAAATHLCRIAIVQEPLEIDGIGWARACGVSQVKLRMTDAGAVVKYADLIDGTGAALAPTDGGSVRVFWHTAEAGDVWASVGVGMGLGLFPAEIAVAAAGYRQWIVWDTAQEKVKWVFPVLRGEPADWSVVAAQMALAGTSVLFEQEPA